jgi:LuxR family transcriptional regulator, maltose regulon positive regulatory protein
VAEAEPEGVIRPFLDEGAPMAAVLAALRPASPDDHRRTGGRLPDYLDTLLAAFIGQRPPPYTSTRASAVLTGSHLGALVEPLGARELDVLRLLSAGRSNAEMAGAPRELITCLLAEGSPV